MPGAATETDIVLPLHAETVSVQRREIETGRVRVSTKTVSEDVAIRELLTQQHAEVERVAIGEYVDDPPQVREDGDYTIIPVVEEVLFVQKRLFLKEEIRIRRTRTTRLHEEVVTLRREEAAIEHTTADDAFQAADPIADMQPTRE